MTKKVQETTLNISLKTLLTISSVLFLLVGEYIVLHKEIEEAKILPKTEINKIEFDYLKSEIKELKLQIDELEKHI